MQNKPRSICLSPCSQSLCFAVARIFVAVSRAQSTHGDASAECSITSRLVVRSPGAGACLMASRHVLLSRSASIPCLLYSNSRKKATETFPTPSQSFSPSSRRSGLPSPPGTVSAKQTDEGLGAVAMHRRNLRSPAAPVGADDFAQPLATKELYGCGIPLAGTVRPLLPVSSAPEETLF